MERRVHTPPVEPADDNAIRLAARAFVEELKAGGNGIVTWHDLQAFAFHEKRIRLIGQTGIIKPRGFEAALTIMTTYTRNPQARPYADEEGADGYHRYKWRGDDADHADNRSLRAAMRDGKPLIWFVGVASGMYVPVSPVYLIAEERASQQFVLAFDGIMREQWEMADATLMTEADLALRREYAVVTTRRRLHQPVFRRRVISAYRSQCGVCRLRHVELLDAAHIREDSQGGEPVVPNGVAMCALHHRAFDSNVIGIRPTDYTIETNKSVLLERDGPTLRHALQEVHGSELQVPRRRDAQPNRELLEERYERFRAAS